MDLPGKRIRKWREHLILSGKQFAEYTGVPYSTLKTLENNEDPNKFKPSYDVLYKITQAYPNLSSEWLLNGTGDMLRDGRALTPLPSPPTDPQPPSVVAMQASSAEVDDAERARYWKQIAEERGRQLEEARERELWYRELVAKKPEDNDEAATRRGAMRVAA